MLEQCITSFFDGRMRLRHDGLRDPARVAMLTQMLPGLPGILSVNANARTGSLLITYDADALDKDAMLALLQQGERLLGMKDSAEAPSSCTPCSCRRWRQGVYKAMLASLGASVAFGFAGRSRPHLWAGGIFLALNAVHMWDKRRAL